MGKLSRCHKNKDNKISILSLTLLPLPWNIGKLDWV